MLKESVLAALPPNRRGQCTLLRDNTLPFQITFVANENDREVVLVVGLLDLLLENQDFFEGLARCYRVDQKKPVAVPHAQFPHCRVLLLTNFVYVQQDDLVVDLALFAVGVYRGKSL